MKEEYKEKIRKFLHENKVKNPADDDDIFKRGFVDSLFALKLVMFVENEFKIKISNKELKQENFRTINVMADTIDRIKNPK